jgi:hypothetical protein
MLITTETTLVITGSPDQEGVLVFVDERLAAVLVRLAHVSHPAQMRGKWFLEAGFGPCASSSQKLFSSLEEAEAWIRRALAV